MQDEKSRRLFGRRKPQDTGPKSGPYTPFYNDRLLLKGDLHCHSIYSDDGVFSIEKIVHYCRLAQLDFAAVTDHNDTRSIGHIGRHGDFTLIAGMEASLDECTGHFNVLGIQDIPLCALDAAPEEVVRYMAEMRAKGARIQLNHPFSRGLGWRIGWDVPYTYFEVWNRIFNTANQDALEWWHTQLCAGARIVGTGGTDSHGTKAERYPINCVYARQNSAEGILQAVDAGNLFVAECAWGPWLQLRMGDAIQGDARPFTADTPLELYAENLAPGYTLHLISDAGTELTFREMPGYLRYTLVPDAQRLFYRLEVWRDENCLAAFSNPLYNTATGNSAET